MYDRAERLKELFKEQIVALMREVKDPGISGFITVTGLDLSVDRKTATVYYSVLGSETERERTAKALERAAPYLRVLLKKRVTVKVVPSIVFAYDDTPKKASRIDELLNKLDRERDDR
jgi:ribosome-binding factor A